MQSPLNGSDAMKLYHATISPLVAGQTIIADRPCTYYVDGVRALEQAKPVGAPSRDICLFASDDAQFAYFFSLHQRHEHSAIRVFEVNIDPGHRAPMALVHVIDRALKAGKDTRLLVDEYWQPSRSWKGWEVFGPQMHVVAEIAVPTIDEYTLQIYYDIDCAAAAKMA